MGKQNEYRFNLKFDEDDEDHRRVSDFLNKCGRKKARYVVKAMLAYWDLKEGKAPIIDRQEEEAPVKDKVVTADEGEERKKERLIQVDTGGDVFMDQEEAKLMMLNYAMFADMEGEG